MMEQHNGVEFPDPWYVITDSKQIALLTEELNREVNNGHVLYRKSTSIIARRDDCDDILAMIDNDIYQYAQIHLNWAKNTISDANWPKTILFQSFEEWKSSAS